MSGNLISWQALNEKLYADSPFILEPFIAEGGITFLFGASSTGKSPVTWSMARAIGEGVSWFGLPTRQCRVLYIDVDSPERVAAERLQLVRPAPPNVWFYFAAPLSIPAVVGEDVSDLLRVRAEVNPEVIFINTLRKVHDLDDKDSRTAKIVYSWFQHMFPGAALVFVHHPRKQSTQAGVKEVLRETASGTLAFVNDAQVGCMLQSFKGPSGNLRLYHQKSQVSRLIRPLPLHIASDGLTISCPLYEEHLKIYTLLNDLACEGLGKGEIDKRVALELGFSAMTARRRREKIETYGPIPPWLFEGMHDGEEEEDE